MGILIEIASSIFTKLKHPRGKLRFIVHFIFILVFAKFFYIFTLTTASIYIVLLTVFMLVTYKSIDNVILFSKYKLDKLGEIIEQGRALESPELFSNKPWYLIDTKEKMEYLNLKADYHEQRRENLKAYKSYLQIQKLKLSDQEAVQVKINRALLLFKMGAYKKVGLILDELEKKIGQLEAKKLGYYYNLKAFIVEKKELDLNKSLNLLQKAKDYISDLEEEYTLKAQLYNNFGRIRRLQNNLTDARSYYKKAKKHVVKTNKASLITVIFSNLIIIYSTQKNYDLLEKTKEEYQNLLEDNLFTREEKMNLQLSIARENLSPSDYKTFLIDSYFSNRQGLDEKRLLIFNATTLRLMDNSGMNAQVVADQIAKNIDTYFKFSMPHKFLLLHEIYIFMKNQNNLKKVYSIRQAPIQSNLKLENAIKMKEKVETYMKNRAAADIENYLDSLEEYQIERRLEFLQHKIGVITKHHKSHNFDEIYSLFLDLIDICKKNGFKKREIETELNLVNEILSLLDKNYGDELKLKERMLNHLENLDQSFSEIEVVPCFDKNYIMMSYYYLRQDKVEKAEKYFDILRGLEVNPRYYSNWIKKQLRVVYEHFS